MTDRDLRLCGLRMARDITKALKDYCEHCGKRCALCACYDEEDNTDPGYDGILGEG